MTFEQWFRRWEMGLTEGKRARTFRKALELVQEHNGPIPPTIVETGCQREPEDWGAGCSTLLFADFVRTFGGEVDTVDNSPEHVARCNALLERAGHPAIANRYGSPVCVFTNDSVAFLRSRTTGIDLLYLDSFDYPYGKLLDIYGGKTDIAKAREALEAMPEDVILARHGFIVAESQEHCANEIRAAKPHLQPGAVVLIDDVLPGGGKPRLAKQLMREWGWEFVMEEYQTLWRVR